MNVDAAPNMPESNAEVVKPKRKRRKVLTSKVYMSADGFMGNAIVVIFLSMIAYFYNFR